MVDVVAWPAVTPKHGDASLCDRDECPVPFVFCTLNDPALEYGNLCPLLIGFFASGGGMRSSGS